MLSALLLGQALCCFASAPAPPPQPCAEQCPPADYAPVAYEEVQLGDDFFLDGGGVGPAVTPSIYGDYGGYGVYVVNGGAFDGRFGSGVSGWRAGGWAGVSSRASAAVRVGVSGGHRGGGGKR